jgi:hypothetical protein
MQLSLLVSVIISQLASYFLDCESFLPALLDSPSLSLSLPAAESHTREGSLHAQHSTGQQHGTLIYCYIGNIKKKYLKKSVLSRMQVWLSTPYI